ncbi:Protein terminal ear1 [Senna tora]|uniref:Protein terminal ear1 n=1 Tax=Senna tora TaxID=362788 RepID=A0A834TN08_9FABA|nr:Protein terminal ear1 [Senna tora]
MTSQLNGWLARPSRVYTGLRAGQGPGKEKLQKHLEGMNFPCEWEEVLPLGFSPPSDGTNNPVQRTIGKLVNLSAINS